MAEITGLRNNALPYPIYAQPFGITFPMLDADGDLVTGATTPDAEVSKNGDTFADCTNESTEIATTSGVYYLLLTATEMTADVVTVIAKSATAGMKTTVITLYPRKLVTIRSGTAAGGAAGSITLDSGASAVDDFYNGCVVAGVLDSTNEVRVITDYTGSTKVAAVAPNWNTTPDSDDTFIVYLPEGMQKPSVNVTHWNELATVALPLVPTTAGRTLDVSAGGEAGVDWANVGSPTTTVGLSGTTVKTATDVETDTADIQSRLPAALTGDGNIKADTLRIGGTLQTARDIGASVLLSSGTGTGQLKLASGYVAMTWADIAAPTTTVNLSGTTIKTATDVETDTAEIGAAGAGLTNINLPNQTMDITGNITGNLSGSVGTVTGAVGSVTGNVGGNVTGSVGSIATGGIAAASFAANAITAATLDPDVTTELQSGLATAANLATVAGYLDTEIAAILADTNELQTDWADGGRLDLILDARASQSSLSSLITTVGVAGAGLTAADDAVITAIAALNNISTAQVNAEVDTALADVGLTSTITGRIDAAVSSRATPAQILTTALTEAYAVDGSEPTLSQFMYMVWAELHEFSISGTTITSKKLDKSTTAMTHTLNSSTTPTSRTRAT